MNNDLRLMLLIIGCCLVLGVYLWEIFRKRKKRNKTDILNAVDDIPDMSITPDNDFSNEDYNKAIADLTELSVHLQNGSTATEPIINSSGKRENNSHIEELTENNINVINNDNEIEENILVFYITARDNNEFNGAIIKKILTEIGMMYGDMDIFHYYEDNIISNSDAELEIKNRSDSKPLFSVANMYEPGTFLAEMDKLKTKGIVAFMYEIKSINSYKIFENIFFLNVQRIAETLNGDIKTSNYKLLDATSLELIREKFRLYAMKDFLENEPK